MIGFYFSMDLVARTGVVVGPQCLSGSEGGDCTLVMSGKEGAHMAGIYQEVHPYQPNVTKSCAMRTFSWAHFFKEMHESFCVFSMKGSVPRICKNIFKKVSQKYRNFRLKIGYNSGCNIKYTWLLKVKYLLNGSTDLCLFCARVHGSLRIFFWYLLTIS